MKDIHKNPIFYYVLVPAITGVFPLIAWGVYVPGIRSILTEEKEQYQKAQVLIGELLRVDPQRIEFTQQKGRSARFDYATAVQQAAEFCLVPSSSYRLSSGIITTSGGGQKSQSANISLKDVDIAKAARFLSTVQLRWSGLRCTKIALRKKKGMPDSWDVDFAFKYFY
jgi:hypothetical protein